LLTKKERQWLAVCEFASKLFSTCAKRQYFAVLLGANGEVLSVGYNGAPKGQKHCNEGGCPALNSDQYLIDSCTAIHAETNAILMSGKERAGGTLIVNGVPCFSCAKNIVNGGIRRVVFHRFPESYIHDYMKILMFLSDAGVEVESCHSDDIEEVCVDAVKLLNLTGARVTVTSA
jgi:deoxycytidylate deaminase